MKRFLFIVLAAVSLSLDAQDNNPRVWLRGDRGLSETQWINQAQNKTVFAPPGSGKHSLAWMNFNPVLLTGPGFGGLDASLDSLGFLQHTMLLVYQTDIKNIEQGLWELKLNGSYRLGLSSSKVYGLGSSIGYNAQPVSTPILHVVSQRWIPGQADSTSGDLALGRYDTLLFRGAIAEYILFPTVLTRKEFRTWQTYLALKYAITLKEFDYINSAGDTVWNADRNQDYTHDIAGISRDDRFGLYQRQSESQGDVIAIGARVLAATNTANLAVLPDRQCMAWGHNGEPLIEDDLGFQFDSVTFVPLLRHWRMQITGDGMRTLPTNVMFQVPVYVTGPGSEPVMIIDPSDGPGLSMTGLRVFRPDSIDAGTGRAWFSDVTWDTDGSGSDLFTFAIPLTNETGTDESVVSGPSIILYPNPTRGEFALEINLEMASPIRTRLWDSEGSLVSTKLIPATVSYLYNDRVNVPGVYNVSVETDSGSYTMKLVVN